MINNKFYRSFLVIFSLSGFIACSDDITDNKLAEPEINQARQSEAAFNALEDDNYIKPTGIDLDYLLIKNVPDIFDKFGEKFIHDWFLAYDCEYAALVKNNSKFNSHGYDLISDVIAGKYDYPNNFIDWGPGTIILTDYDNTSGKLSDYIRLYKNSYSGSRLRDSECPDTKSLYTRHEFIFKRIKELDIEIPDRILDTVKDNSKSITIKLVIKFTINKTSIKTSTSSKRYLIKHWADIDELQLYPYSSNFSQEPFLVLYNSDLYE